MLIGLALLLWVAVLGWVLPASLDRAAWPHHAPRLAVAVWVAAGASFLLSLVIAGLAIAVPGTGLHAEVAHLVMRCVAAYREAYGSVESAVAASAGLVVAVGAATRAAWFVSSGLRTAAKRRREHARALRLIARHDQTLDALVVDHTESQAYCLPGRAGGIVVTSAAVARLRGDELAAVLAHERAHMTGRHHLVGGVAFALERAWPGVPLFRSAATAVPVLLELCADDAAGRQAGRVPVARALLAFAHEPPPAGLGITGSGSAAALRIARLAQPQERLGHRRTVSKLALVCALVGMPVTLTVVPAAMEGPAAECCLATEATATGGPPTPLRP
jgi:Zn-dependent protease with chaperone function